MNGRFTICHRCRQFMEGNLEASPSCKLDRDAFYEVWHRTNERYLVGSVPCDGCAVKMDAPEWRYTLLDGSRHRPLPDHGTVTFHMAVKT
jgi:hypothetical protein